MKEFLKTILKFFSLALIGYFLVINIWSFVPASALKPNVIYPAGGKGYLQQRIKEAKNTEDIDLLFLGSSHTYRGFDTRIFKEAGYKSFNLGSSSQTPLQTKVLLEKYLDQMNPDMIIYEVYPSTFQNDGVESSLDVIANTPLDVATMNMALSIGNLKTINALIVDLFRESLSLNDIEQQTFENANYVAGGFVETDINENLSPINEQMRAGYANSKWQIRPDQWDTFIEILKNIKEKNISYLLVQMPVTRDAYSLYLNNDSLDGVFSKHGAYLNLNTELDLDDRYDFMDYHHLNQQGVEKSNQFIIDFLEVNFEK